jgi:ferredoxin
MNGQLHIVDSDTCKGDGLCVDVCPHGVIELVDEIAATVDDQAETCIRCGQCVAVCPTEALRLQTIPEEDFKRIKRPSFDFEQFHEFLRTRRSVRMFKDKEVTREDIDKILTAAATAPMGFPPHTTEVLVIDETKELNFLLEYLVNHYDGLLKAFSSPIGRMFIRLSTGAETYGMLRNHIVESATKANEKYRRDKTDRYMYGAPVVMIFHANRWTTSYAENGHLVCHHAMLAALSLGLGTTIIGMIPPVLERSGELRSRYGIPRDNRVLTSLILGHPRYRYRQGIRRDLAGVRFNALHSEDL